MTPPASPGSKSKSDQLVKEESTTTKVEEAVGMLPTPEENVTSPEAEESIPSLPLPTSTIENGQIPEIFPLPLPPTPNVSPIAVSI